MFRAEFAKFEKKLVRVYTDALGVRRRVGKKDALKESQSLGPQLHLLGYPGTTAIHTYIYLLVQPSQPRTYTAEFGQFLCETFQQLKEAPICQGFGV